MSLQHIVIYGSKFPFVRRSVGKMSLSARTSAPPMAFETISGIPRSAKTTVPHQGSLGGILGLKYQNQAEFTAVGRYCIRKCGICNLSPSGDLAARRYVVTDHSQPLFFPFFFCIHTLYLHMYVCMYLQYILYRYALSLYAHT